MLVRCQKEATMIFVMSEGTSAKNTSTTNIPIGISMSMNGGGGRGGSINGRTTKEAVNNKRISTDVRLK